VIDVIESRSDRLDTPVHHHPQKTGFLSEPTETRIPNRFVAAARDGDQRPLVVANNDSTRHQTKELAERARIQALDVRAGEVAAASARPSAVEVGQAAFFSNLANYRRPRLPDPHLG
jgi:hypothetical protein